MKRRNYLIILLFITITISFQSYATVPDTLSVHTKELGEVTVTASNFIRKDDCIIAIPTKMQRKHAVNGYDLLRNLMIPGITVDRSNGNVTTPAGTSTVYIDGREVEFREVQSLRPKDIAKIEYFDIPTGKYAKDAAAVNFILKPLDNGGYTQLDALQGVGYLQGDYNLITKYVTGAKSINLWAGYALNDPKSSSDEIESFNFEDGILNRSTSYHNSGNRESKEYLQASISNRGKKYIWMLRGGLAWNNMKRNVDNGMTSYFPAIATAEDNKITSISNLLNHDKTLRPSLYYYGLNTFSATKSLEYVVDGYYSRNDHNRQYNEGTNIFNSLVKENYYYTKINANYSMTLSHRNKLAISLYEFLRISDSDYSGNSSYNQNLRSSETILFTDYSQRLGRFFYDINPGLSFLSYKLKGMKSINRFTPRLQARMAYMIARNRQLQFAFALGNTYPQINTINNVEQAVDPIIILKGNPEMNNSILLNPRISYNLNLNKIALQTGLSYFYRNHAIVSDYYFRDGNLISTFRDDFIYHQPGVDLSLTYKPSNSLNLNISGQWNEQIAKGDATNHSLSSFKSQMAVNYYAGEFSFGAMLSSPSKNLIDLQIYRKTYWHYQLSAMWAHQNWAVEVNANNLFMMNNNTIDKLSTTAYSFTQTNRNRRFNQYATLKAVYCFDYGKKTSKSPKYERVESESAILK
ncbi:MAG: outer membrane beta-barrel family protein [Muribaculaceae bacterium]|nr:outer membrane beta-barrel family protein [Muribaculaceae bacterium]